MKTFREIREGSSAQSRLDKRAAKLGLGKKSDRLKKATDFFNKPPPSFSKAELKKMGYAVESSSEYGKSMDRIRDKKKNDAIKSKDRKTLSKIADLMKKQK